MNEHAAIPAAILGPTGYTGLELIEWLLRHPRLRIAYLASARENPPRIDAEFPRLRGRLPDDVAQCRPLDPDAIVAACRGGVAFLCLPHEAAMHHAKPLVERGLRVVDLSAAYRLRNASTYALAYGHPHTDAAGLAGAVYGLPELDRAGVAAASLVANPGCYPTPAALALCPLLRGRLIEPTGIIVNAASGVSGAGRDAKPHLMLAEAGENFSAYGIGVHRHQPEIAQTLQRHGDPTADVLFVPHLLPIERGILETIYAAPRPGVDTGALQACLQAAYADETFVSVRPDAPQIRDVARTNRVHINARLVRPSGESAGARVVLTAVVDNLVKGAAGQAIQNANLMLGLPEQAGLV